MLKRTNHKDTKTQTENNDFLVPLCLRGWFVFWVVLTVTLFCCAIALHAEEPLNPGLHNFSEEFGDYSIYVPTVNTHMLIVALHGSGERASGYIENWLP